jgi:hypothetical protein
MIMVRNRLIGSPLMVYGSDTPNMKTLEFLATTQSRTIAEIGVERGATSKEILRWLDGLGCYTYSILRIESNPLPRGYTERASQLCFPRQFTADTRFLQLVSDENVERRPDPLFRLTGPRRRPHLGSRCSCLLADRYTLEARRVCRFRRLRLDNCGFANHQSSCLSRYTKSVHRRADEHTTGQVDRRCAGTPRWTL